MIAPFDSLASSYNSLWSDTPRGRGQRQAVWRELEGLFRVKDRVLDLGCGTGDDALHLAEAGVEVLGIDASARMVEAAWKRGVNAFWLRIEDLAELRTITTCFQGAISNFGALNCVADLDAVARQLADLLEPGGPVVICMMGRMCWSDWRHLLQRWRGHARWRGINVYYPTSARIRAAFDRFFTFEKQVSIGRGDHQLYIFRRRADARETC